MAIPDYQTLMLPVLTEAAKGETGAKDLAPVLAEAFGLTEEEREALLPSGRQRILHNRIHWARFYLEKAGLVETVRRSRFQATERGRRVLEARPDRIDNKYLTQFPEFVEFFGRRSAAARGDDSTNPVPEDRNDEGTDDAHTPEETMDRAYRAYLAALKEEVLAATLGLSPERFEQLIVDLLVAMGYGGTAQAALKDLYRGGDGGIDGVIDEDRLGLDRIYVQAKRYRPGNSVGRQDVQAFVGSLVGLGAHKGVFVTTAAFTANAEEYVRRLSQRVVLIDGERLADLMIRHGVGVRTTRVLEIGKLDQNFFGEDD